MCDAVKRTYQTKHHNQKFQEVSSKARIKADETGSEMHNIGINIEVFLLIVIKAP